MITARRSLTALEQQAAAVAVQAAAIELVRRSRPLTAAAHVPTGTEPGGADLPARLAEALPPGSRLLLPVLRDDHDLDWAAYAGPASLAPGPYGLREPVGPRLGVEAIRDAALIVVPALAVDRGGRRLGRGGGSYDRALTRARGWAVALLHDGELVARLPAEPHDRPVDAAIAPASGFTLLRRADPDEPAGWTK